MFGSCDAFSPAFCCDRLLVCTTFAIAGSGEGEPFTLFQLLQREGVSRGVIRCSLHIASLIKISCDAASIFFLLKT
ncbi:hypothetical protein GOP47_0002771 [Adiantum capillus-veneris]|uniref:Uncharacterized protein n=1 Tax=Adiantum capillus-veneris TaxID=13818 RepID=A0A9D4VCF3_ADICA|nr:hypothetical protein GOP47_0002771 [Adiantum capillus-veneris]